MGNGRTRLAESGSSRRNGCNRVRMYRAFILAAGLGTRLHPLTLHTPKPLVPICGVPMLAYNLALCARHGLRSVLVNVHHLADQFTPWEREREGVAVTLSREAEILGTGGSLRAARDGMAPTFAVVNGDVISNVDLTTLTESVPEHGAVLALRSSEDVATLGVVAADATGTVVQIKDFARAEARGEVDRTTHFTGVHAMDRRVLSEIPPSFCCVMRTVYTSLVQRHRLRGISHGGLWVELTDPGAFLSVNLRVLRGDLAPPLDPIPRAAWSRSGDRVFGDPAAVEGVCVRGSAWVGPGAELEAGARLSDTVVGAGARVSRGASLEQSVVWHGVSVPPGRYSRCVVHPGGVLQVS